MVSTSQVSLKAQPEPSGLHVEVVRDQHVTTVFVTGDVDLATADLLSAAADLALQGPPLRVVVDLSGVSFFGVVGLTVLLNLRERASRAAIDLMLRAPSQSVRTVLGLMGAAPYFRIASAGFRRVDRGQSLASTTAVSPLARAASAD